MLELLSVERRGASMKPACDAGSDAEGPLILLTRHASGDEEISAAGLDVRGVLLCQSLPHLSHLGAH